MQKFYEEFTDTLFPTPPLLIDDCKKHPGLFELNKSIHHLEYIDKNILKNRYFLFWNNFMVTLDYHKYDYGFYLVYA